MNSPGNRGTPKTFKQRWHDWWHGCAPLPAPAPETEAPPPEVPEPVKQTVVTPDAPNILPEWTGDRIELLSHLWGEGNAAPTEDVFFNTMYSQLGLNNTMTVLDVGDGMAGAGIALAHNFKCFVEAYITNPDYVQHATKLLQKHKVATRVTMHPYDLDHIKLQKKFDAVSLRRVLWRVPDPQDFISNISGHLRERARLVLLDYMADTPVMAQENMAKWFQDEHYRNSISLGHVLNILEKNGFEVRVSEDISAQHESEIREGILRLREFVRGYRMSDAHKEMLMHEADRWAFRAGLLHDGLQLYRFFAQRKR